MTDIVKICKDARKASYTLSSYTTDDKNAILTAIAKAVSERSEEIMAANAQDIAAYQGKDMSFLDRLTLNDARIELMCEGVRQVKSLPDPVGEIVEEWTVESGLRVKKVRAALGVVAVIYEARPNVTVDVAALCIKSGNAVILRGGSDAYQSNYMLYTIMYEAINNAGYDGGIIQFINDTDRACTTELLKQGNYVDVVIPRGGERLKKIVLDNAQMPVIFSAGGNCHVYVDKSADIAKAVKVVVNSKVQRPSVCNACEQLLIDRAAAKTLIPPIFDALKANGVSIRGDKECMDIYPDINEAREEDYYTEYHDLIIAVAVVDGVDEAISRINEHSTMHSDAIVAEDSIAIEKFSREVDSGCVYINASTRFTDGFELGFGAEIAISTQKLHARGPLGLRELTTAKYVISGNGTIRK